MNRKKDQYDFDVIDGINYFFVPELEGKKVDFTNMGRLFDIVGYNKMATYTIETMHDDNKLFDHFEVRVEGGYDYARSESGYRELSEREARKFFNYYMSNIKI